MLWQDALYAVGQFVFSLALIPALRGPKKPPALASLVTGLTLLLFGVASYTLALYGAAVAQVVCGCTWLVLFVQVQK